MSNNSIFSSYLSEERWIGHMFQNYVNSDQHPCVFITPDNLRDSKPEAYTPQAVGLGPYHHFRPELQKMDSQKRAAVKEYLKDVEHHNVIHLVMNMPEKFELTIRSCYDRYLDLDKKTLAWIVFIDGIYLLQYVNNYLDPSQNNNPAFQKLAADILMLENQIPIILLREIRETLELSFNVAADYDMFDKFCRFCNEQSPLKLTEKAELRDDAFEVHMLHFMYHMLVKNEAPVSTHQTSREIAPTTSSSNLGAAAQYAGSAIVEIVKDAAELVHSKFGDLRSSGVVVPGNIEQVSLTLQNVQKTLKRYDKSNKYEKVNFLAEEIDVPSVTQLNQIAKMGFALTPGGIRNIRLDEKQNILYLPKITLRANSEVILRNLMAYEAASLEPGSTLELTEYMDLMCGIIDTVNDVNLLKKADIIDWDDLDEEAIVDIFNGIRKSNEKPNDKSRVHRIVKKANEQFGNRGIVKVFRCIKNFFATSQNLIKMFFPILVLLLLAMQSFCQIYGCRANSYRGAERWDLPQGDEAFYNSDPQAKLMMPRKLFRY